MFYDIPFDPVQQPHMRPQLLVQVNIQRVFPGLQPRQKIDPIEHAARPADGLEPLAQVVGNIVADPTAKIENPQPAAALKTMAPSPQAIPGLGLAVADHQSHILAPYAQLEVGQYLDLEIGVITAVIAFVGIVRLKVVFETVYNVIVVHIEAEEELGPIRAIAQEGLFVIGEDILVLVVVVDKVAVFVQARPGHLALTRKDARR